MGHERMVTSQDSGVVVGTGRQVRVLDFVQERTEEQAIFTVK